MDEFDAGPNLRPVHDCVEVPPFFVALDCGQRRLADQIEPRSAAMPSITIEATRLPRANERALSSAPAAAVYIRFAAQLFDGSIHVRTSYSGEGVPSLGPERDDRVDPCRSARGDHGRGDCEDENHGRSYRQRDRVHRTNAEQHCLHDAGRATGCDETETGTH